MSLPLIFSRSRNSTVEAPTTWTTKVYTDGVLDSSVSYGGLGDFTTKVMGDQKNTQWRKQRDGNVVMAPCMIVKRSRVSGGSAKVDLATTGSGHTRMVSMEGDFSSSGFEDSVSSLFNVSLEKDIETMASVSYAKCCAKINTSDLVSGEFLMDLNKTLGMLRRPFGGARALLTKIERSRNKHLLKSGSNAVQAMGNAWLEQAYGWRPLFLDIQTIAEKVHEKREMKSELRVARAEVRRGMKNVSDFSFGTFTDPMWGRSGTASRNQLARACSGIMYEIKPRTTSDELLKILGLRARDLAPTMWEVVPFSFVVDWFFNIGDWIQAVSPDPYLVRRGAWCATILKDTVSVDTCNFHYSARTTDEPGVYAKVVSPMNCSTRSVEEYRRDTDPTYGNFPVWTGKPLSLPHAISGVSLMLPSILKRLNAFYPIKRRITP